MLNYFLSLLSLQTTQQQTSHGLADINYSAPLTAPLPSGVFLHSPEDMQVKWTGMILLVNVFYCECKPCHRLMTVRVCTTLHVQCVLGRLQPPLTGNKINKYRDSMNGWTVRACWEAAAEQWVSKNCCALPCLIEDNNSIMSGLKWTYILSLCRSSHTCPSQVHQDFIYNHKALLCQRLGRSTLLWSSVAVQTCCTTD